MMNFVLSVSDGQVEDLDVVKLTVKNSVSTENSGIQKSSL